MPALRKQRARLGSLALLTPIRDADPERDAAGCLAVYAPYVTDSVISFEDEPPSVDEFTERMGSTTKTHPWLVYEDGGEIVGYAYAHRHMDRAAYRWAANVAVYLAASHHRRGIGRTLYTELFTRLKAQGFQVLIAGVTLPNDASVGLHRSLGFEPVGTYRRIGWKNGAWHDVAWFQLELAPATSATPPEPRPPR